MRVLKKSEIDEKHPSGAKEDAEKVDVAAEAFPRRLKPG
jgi:hypothetical protein